MIYEKWGNMKYKYKNREFWCRGYYVDTTGKNTAKISQYIENQLKEDRLGDVLPFSEDAFRRGGGRVRQAVKTLFKRG